MCGIAGIFNIADRPPIERRILERMIWPVHHRGPDGFGFYHDADVGLAHARLSIIDLEGGWQPIHNEDKTLWVVFNGEIFNYRELRKELEDRGHRFSTHSDTEVIVHLYEEKGERCLEDLNGQFAIALYDTRARSLFLARDRMGIRPLFYATHDGRFFFGSEIKSIFAADGEIPRALAPQVLQEIFTFWMAGGEDTVFMGVRQLEPGHWMRVFPDGRTESREYWDIPFGASADATGRDADGYAAELRALLIDATRLRLRADVPVGAYLSGGLDSSTLTALVRNYTTNDLKTFSVAFRDAVYDESGYQREVSAHLGTEHHVVECGYKTIADAFSRVVWHAETPIIRTAPTPLLLLSGLVRDTGYKVVLTGEGADEILGGYDLFKEAKIRAFVHRNPDSAFRALLFKRLYPYLALSPTRSAAYARQFFDTDADPNAELFYAHGPRWKTTEHTQVFLSAAVKEQWTGSPVQCLADRLAGKLEGLDPFSRAQYVESRLLLPNYLLSSQGDRMAMANSVEGRFPFLDHRVVEFACRIPPKLRMRGLDEKYVLKQAVRDLLPASVTTRKKQPYMAPDALSFFADGEADCIGEHLSPEALLNAGLFQPNAVAKLLQKCRKPGRQGFRENMALVGILSTQILHDKFVRNFRVEVPETLKNVKVVN